MMCAQNGLLELTSAGTPQTREGRVRGTKNAPAPGTRVAVRSQPGTCP
jgi:hypothetical protein